MDSFHARPSLVPSTFMRYGTNATRLHGRDSHWNLEALGIVPEAQGRVLGTRLLVHGLARPDQDGLHCYLTSQPITRAPVSPA
jgi:ribosomal protein S18 acetylase RimI-like enzyme